jgi:membrane bound O-acyltransferase family protein
MDADSFLDPARRPHRPSARAWLWAMVETILGAICLWIIAREFWGKRWNLGFRQLSHDLIFRPLHGRLGVGGAGFLVFVISGLLHDLVISVPANGGYGLPTLYFVVQGAVVAVERSRVGKRFGLGQGIAGWIFMAVVTAAPAFWLFHPPFVNNVILPFMKAVGAL